MFKEELLSVVDKWSMQQLNDYIGQLETRITETHSLLRELKQLRRRKSHKKILDNGLRDNH